MTAAGIARRTAVPSDIGRRTEAQSTDGVSARYVMLRIGSAIDMDRLRSPKLWDGSWNRTPIMNDALYLGLGAGLFLLMGVYVAALRRS